MPSYEVVPKVGQMFSSVRPLGRTDPLTGKWQWYGGDFKAKVAVEALRGELTAAQLATKYSIHPTMVGDWKRQAMEGLTAVFAERSDAREKIKSSEGEIEKLHAKTGQLLVERDFLAKASGR